MSENQTKTEQVTNKVEKVIAAVGARVEAAVGELNNLQSQGVEQTKKVIEGATRATQEQLAFIEQLSSEWRKLMLGATRTAAELFTPKA